MGIFRKKHDITDIYGVKSRRDDAERLPDGLQPHHYSRHYHNYFRGYTEVRRQTGTDRMKIERYYTKPWIVSALSVQKYWLLRLWYALLTAGSAGLFIAALVQPNPANSSWIVAIPGYSSVISLFLLMVMTVAYIFVARKMTLWDHSSSTKRLKRASLITAILQGITAVTEAGYTLVIGEETAESLWCAVMLLIAALCALAIFLTERRVPYIEIPNDTVLPEGESYEIR